MALARCLRGEPVGDIGFPRWVRAVLRFSNWLPPWSRTWMYKTAAWLDSWPESRIGEVRSEEISRYVAAVYPRAKCPIIFVGSSNGALIHLCAALNCPWLPQTFLIGVHQTGIDPDDLQGRMRLGAAPGRALLDANPELQLHHMADPLDDRPPQSVMSYFRIKRRTLGPAYEEFLEDSLEPGGIIVLSDCRHCRPVTTLGDRQFFQAGGFGGLPVDELFRGGPRVERFLSENGSTRRRWEPSAPDREAPEAEWGFEPSLEEDVRRFAALHGYRVDRLIFQGPDDLSPVIAELYRHWYRSRGIPDDRLFAEILFLLEPHWTLRTGCVPYWLTMNTRSSAECLAGYLRASEPYSQIRLVLLSTAIASVELVPTDEWRRLVLNHATQEGAFLGSDPRRYPIDLASLVRYHHALAELPWRAPASERPLRVDEAIDFIRGGAHTRRLRWETP